MKPGFTSLLQNQDLSSEAKKAKGADFVVKPNFTTLLQNQDSTSEAKKAEKKFFGETQFHNIDAKPGFVVGSKKSRGRGFWVKPGFISLMQNQDSTLEAKKAEDKVLW